MKQEYIISAYSENHIGLLNRITIIFTRRKVNIESLTVSESALAGISKFTIVVNEEKEKVINIVKQIEKLIEVLKAFYHTNDEMIFQEIALYKVPTQALMDSDQIEKMIRLHNARILEITKEYTVIEKTGHKEETQALFEGVYPVRPDSNNPLADRTTLGVSTRKGRFVYQDGGEDEISLEYLEFGVLKVKEGSS
jgi:acetolactate synthase-1/3 small subunit